MATQKERRAVTRQKILDAAADLFSRNGFDNSSVVQIAERANVVKGTFYQHFETKMDLLVALGRQDGAEQVRGLIEKVQQGLSPIEALKIYYLIMAQWFEANAPMAQDVIISAIRMHDPDSKTPEYTAHDFTQLMIEYAQERGEIRTDINSANLAFVLGGAFTLAVVDWCRNPKNSLLQTHTTTCLTVFFEGAKVT